MQYRYRVGEDVTVVPEDQDPYILQFQRYATVSRVHPGPPHSFHVRLANTCPPGQEFGPFPSDQLLKGWKNSYGEWRRW